MTGALTALGPLGTALALLVLGHVLGDFALQTDEIANTKHRFGPLLIHGTLVILAHLVAFVPLLTVQTGLVVLLVGVSHLLVDAVSARVRPREATSVPLFLGDQFVHLLVILAGWSLLDPSTLAGAPVVGVVGDRVPVSWAQMTTGAVYLSTFIFAHEGGNAIVRGVLPEGPETDEEDDLEAGSLIGSLERWIVVLLGLVGRWEAVGLVVTAKSIARFEELKKRVFAEYFLVGTLTSVLVAIVLVVVVSALV